MSKKNQAEEAFVTINASKCNGCGSCVIICGAEVFELKGKKAVVRTIEGCLECGNCEVVCTSDAISFRIPKGGTGIVYECG